MFGAIGLLGIFGIDDFIIATLVVSTALQAYAAYDASNKAEEMKDQQEEAQAEQRKVADGNSNVNKERLQKNAIRTAMAAGSAAMIDLAAAKRANLKKQAARAEARSTKERPDVSRPTRSYGSPAAA